MPSPFPGMDPFIEGQRWSGFHAALIPVIQEKLTPRLVPRYIVEIEERVYLEHHPEEQAQVIIPDLAVVEQEDVPLGEAAGGGAATAVAVRPVLLPLPMPERHRDTYLTVRERESGNIVTVIEVLSPRNKRSGSDGRRVYLRKRERVLLSFMHLVEIDLLRGGARLPVEGTLPAGDYYAMVSRGEHPRIAEVYAWSLRRPLPPIPVPLAETDEDVCLELHDCLTTVYDRAGYSYALNYRRAVQPPLDEADAAWVQELLAARSA